MIAQQRFMNTVANSSNFRTLFLFSGFGQILRKSSKVCLRRHHRYYQPQRISVNLQKLGKKLTETILPTVKSYLTKFNFSFLPPEEKRSINSESPLIELPVISVITALEIRNLKNEENALKMLVKKRHLNGANNAEI